MSTLIISMKIDDVWQDLLKIPKSELAQFSPRPLKWLTFVAYAISGSKGQLSLDGNTPIASGDHSNQPVSDRYYYIYKGTKQFLPQ